MLLYIGFVFRMNGNVFSIASAFIRTPRVSQRLKSSHFLVAKAAFSYPHFDDPTRCHTDIYRITIKRYILAHRRTVNRLQLNHFSAHPLGDLDINHIGLWFDYGLPAQENMKRKIHIINGHSAAPTFVPSICLASIARDATSYIQKYIPTPINDIYTFNPYLHVARRCKANIPAMIGQFGRRSRRRPIRACYQAKQQRHSENEPPHSGYPF